MSTWTSIYVNDPDNDYEVVVELFCDDKIVAWITQGENGLNLKWFPHKKDIIVPVDWLIELFAKVKKSFRIK